MQPDIIISNSCAILSRTQLYVTLIASIVVLVILGLLSVVITGIELVGLMKIAVLFFAAVCLAAVAAMTFVIMAFRRGRGRSYWISMALGIMLIALSGLAALFCYAIGGKWVGIITDSIFIRVNPVQRIVGKCIITLWYTVLVLVGDLIVNR